MHAEAISRNRTTTFVVVIIEPTSSLHCSRDGLMSLFRIRCDLDMFAQHQHRQNQFAHRHFYARKQNASRVFAIVWASVCPSVCPSVTLLICIKTVQARITKSSLWAAPRSLVYRDKTSCHWVQGFPSNEGVEEGYPLKKTSFCRYWLE